MVILFFWFFLIFLISSIALVMAPALGSFLPELGGIERVYFSYPVLLLNVATCAYLVYYFSALQDKPQRVFLILLFFSLSIAVGSSASLVFEAKIADFEVFKFAFGDSAFTSVVFVFAIVSAGWAAKQYHQNTIPSA